MTQNAEMKAERMKQALLALRRIAGWTDEEMADKLGISRASIVNMPRKGITLIQYYAIRYILDEKIADDQDMLLGEVVWLLIEADVVSDDQRTQICERLARSTIGKSKKVGMKKSIQKAVRDEALLIIKELGLA